MLTPPFSPIDCGVSASVTVGGVDSASVIVRAVPAAVPSWVAATTTVSEPSTALSSNPVTLVVTDVSPAGNTSVSDATR